MIFTSKVHLRPTGHVRVLICTSSQHLQHLLISNLGKIENLKTGFHPIQIMSVNSNCDAELDSQEKHVPPGFRDFFYAKQTKSMIFGADFGPRVSRRII